MSDHEDLFEGGDAGASQTRPVQAGAVKKNGFVMLKGHPCKVVEYSTSKTGKHGHAKAHIVGLDIFTGKKYDDICPTQHNMEEPIVKRQEFQVLGISDDNYVSLLTDSGPKDDIQVIDEGDDSVGSQIRKSVNEGKEITATVISAMGQEKVISIKEVPKND